MMRYLFCLLLFLLPQVSFAEVRLAVLEFRGMGVSDGLLQVLTDKVRSGVLHVSKGQKIKGEKLIIMTRENMMQVLKDQGKTAADCQGECEVELARNIGADYVISGNVSKIDELYVLVIKMHETAKSNLLGSETIKTEVKTELMSEAERVGALIFQEGLGLKPPSQSVVIPKGFTGKELEAWKASGTNEIITTIDSKPNGAGVVVIMDGNVLCTETPCTQTIPSGPHNISIQKKRYKEWSEQVLFTKGKNVKANLVVDFGYLTLKTDPAGIQFKLNGESVTSPIKAKILDKGPYQLQIDDPCHVGKQGQTYQFQISEDAHEKVNFETIERSAGIKVRVQGRDKKPVEADLFVDGKAIGKSPGTFTVGVCSKELRANLGGQEAKAKLKLVEQETATHELTLHQKYKSYTFSFNIAQSSIIYNPTTNAMTVSASPIIIDGLTYRGFGARIAQYFLSHTDIELVSYFPVHYRTPKLWGGVELQYEFYWLWQAEGSMYMLPKHAPIRHQVTLRFTNIKYLSFGPTLVLDGSNNVAFGGSASLQLSCCD
ncbi:MAG: PEGA domain-containing protein [Myxococcota bacterium]|nr:PEGA domain-containing protein [Myxococcota bacterium]